MRQLISAFIAAIALIAATGAEAQEDPGQTELKASHGAWQIRCAVADKNKCFMTQIGNGANGQPLVQVRIQKTPNLTGPKGQKIPAVIQIQAPLGVLLTAGLSLEIDGSKPGIAPYKFCTPRHCVVEEPVDDDLVTRMKKGSAAVFAVVSARSGKRSTSNVSLSGFTAAYNGL